MLRSEDSGVHYEAVGVIGNLVHSSQVIKRKVGGRGVKRAGGEASWKGMGGGVLIEWEEP